MDVEGTINQMFILLTLWYISFYLYHKPAAREICNINIGFTFLPDKALYILSSSFLLLL